MTHSLAQRLKTETRALHTAAERSRFMGVLLRGQMQRPAYLALLRNLHVLYATLEPALARHATHPVLAPVFAPALFRTLALEHDLRALGEPGTHHAIALQPATLAYGARLRELDAWEPELLLAHAYVRYLGDLSGGQMLRRIVAQGKAFDGRSGVAFYEFGDAVETHALTQAFRAGLGRVDVSEASENAIVAEARSSFELHRRLFDELAGACGLA